MEINAAGRDKDKKNNSAMKRKCKCLLVEERNQCKTVTREGGRRTDMTETLHKMRNTEDT